MKKLTAVIALFVCIVLFQNFRSITFSGNTAIAVHIDPDDMQINAAHTDIVHAIRSHSDHELITQLTRLDKVELDSDHLLTQIVKNDDLGQKVFSFETTLNESMYRTRSEIRVRDMDVTFSDTPDDKTYYAKFEIFLPHGDGLNTLPKDNKMWNIIWQVAQVGASANSGFWKNTSPPLSLQLYNRRLYLKRIHDYKRTRDCDIGRWQRDTSKIANYDNPAGSDDACGGDNTVKYRYEVSPSRNTNYAGYVKKNMWNKIFIKYRLGKRAEVSVYVNGVRTLQIKNISLGYQLASDPHTSESDVKFLYDYGSHHQWKIKKRASTRFGLYQGHKYGTIPEYNSKIYFKYYSTGTKWSEVRWALDRKNP